ncbi:MAG TPA: NlpC/P60 family protein [Mycobacterium sp.]|nr:NlpC/P60 family protein [Mycobacterium sp.]
MLKLLGAGGTVTLLVVCLVIAFAAIGSNYVTTASGQSACQLPGTTGGPGVEVFGDSTLTGLASRLPAHLAGGKVTEDVKLGRTAQQGENILNDLPDSAPAIFVISLAEDDASSSDAYVARIDELMLLLSGRTVYWITVPGKDSYTKIVNEENTAGSTGPETAGGWHIVDFAASVTQHPNWWRNDKPTASGVKILAQRVTGLIDASNGTRAPGNRGGITVTSTVDAADTFTLTGERLTNAKTIVAVGTGMGVPVRGEVIAVATATQESKLINLPGGPGDAYGLFQQTPSQGWGTADQVQDPTYAATAFYRHLLAVPDWQDMALTDAAQTVQHSAYPDAYAQWEASATVIVAALLAQHAPGCGPQLSVPGNPRAQVAVNAALSQLGVPYSYTGGNPAGPTLGQCVPGTDGWNDCHIVGFDCSGLMLYAWGKAGVAVPHYTVAMWNDPALVHIGDKNRLQPGDMMMFEGPPPGHVGLYIGNGQLIDAPHSGSVVQIESVGAAWYAQDYIGALRPRV